MKRLQSNPCKVTKIVADVSFIDSVIINECKLSINT